ncbi:hypothetical protein BSL82_11920 [Tardibacter chloracetimidivorans]|uniref:TonB-dependent receptor n=1 Tax=Tardibacter chloracetimidivorans TaxID=1921510 RepID=A0A1L3ZWE7_9SPHN|nr:TonB-dependent receptor [Tardibacter chloracetimidivorans]API59929.1 hypothetical protein BSL82_11920 [Tardibacter chloracetimidivorans]
MTATRQAANLQAVPIAVSAVTPQRLEGQNITSLGALSRIAPSLQVFNAQGPGTAAYQIRGQIQKDTAPTLDPSVGIYFDDVYVARAAGSIGNLLDMERVEVLKGPQGTLFGRNTTGGAVRLISRKPTDEFGGYVAGSYETFDQYRLDAVINIPLGESVAFRAAGRYFHKGGFMTNVLTGDKVDTEKTYFGRAALKIAPNDRLDILVQGDVSHSNYGGTANYLKSYEYNDGPNTARQVAAELGLNPGTPAGVAAGIAALQAEIGLGRRQSNAGDLRFVSADVVSYSPTTGFTFSDGRIGPSARLRVQGGAATLRYDMGWATLRSITSYRHSTYDQKANLDGSGYSIVGSAIDANQKQFSEEILLNGKLFDDRLDWTSGAIFFQEKVAQTDTNASLPNLVIPTGRARQVLVAESRVKAYGVYAQGTYLFNDALSATGGIRYTIDKRDFHSEGYYLALNTAAISCLYTAANGLALVPGFSAPCGIDQGDTFKKINYTGSINYEFAQSRLLYFRTSRGFRAGGFNSRVNSLGVLGAFKPEIVTDYEIGLKADWLDRRLRTNIAMFTSKSIDTQTTVVGLDANNASFSRTTNIGTRKVRGVEVDVTARPVEWMGLDLTVNRIGGRINDPATPDIRFIAQVPKWALNVGGDVSHVSGDYLMKLRSDFSYRSAMNNDAVFRDSFAAIDPATGLTPILRVPRINNRYLLSARFSVAHKPTGMEFGVFGTNLTNNRFDERVTVIGGLGYEVGLQGQPRTVGVDLKMPFGAR